MELELNINGVIASLDVTASETLLSLLRREGYYSVKRGCETGECGACTVQVDGVPRPSCVMLASQAGGCMLTTVEGLQTGAQLHPLQQAFSESGAVQCGFCTSGMLLSAVALLKQNANPSTEEVRDALSGNLCSCTGYEKPVQAVLRAAALLRGDALPEQKTQVVQAREETSSVRAHVSASDGSTTKIPLLSLTNAAGKANKELDASLQRQGIPPLDTLKLVTGKAAFTEDETPRGLLHARILTSPHAHAHIRNIDVSEARALPGVQAVLTYKDVPRVPFSAVERGREQEQPRDQYCLDYRLRYVGDRVAVVAAETPEIAEEALQLIHVDYEVLPALLDPHKALEAGATPIHPEEESIGIYDATRNVAARIGIETGEVERGFAQADLVVESEYFVPMTQTVALEKHSVLTYFADDGALLVRSSTQAPQHVRRTIAKLLNVPLRTIRVVQPAVGGGAEGKQELVFEGLCALLSIVTNQPVMLSQTRAEELHNGPVNQQHAVRLKTGVRRDGTLVAQQIIMLASTGAYATHPLIANTAALIDGLALYPCAHMRFASDILYTNLPPSAALQGMGLPQVYFALECHMDEVAKSAGIDALTLRRTNWLKLGDEYPLYKESGRGKNGPLVESCALPECLRLVEEKLRWREKRGTTSNARMRRGVGVALSLQGAAPLEANTAGTMIKLNEDGSFDVFVGLNESTFGLPTQLAQIASEVLGVSVEHIFMHTANDEGIPWNGGVHGSAQLYISGGAVRRAAEQIRRQMLGVAGRALNVLPESLKIHEGVIQANNGQMLTVRQVAEHALMLEGRQIMTTASWKMPQTPITFAAQGVEVEVDTETGSVRVLKVVTAVDAGQVLNPLISEGQIQGSIARALSAALCEDLLYDAKGAIKNETLRDYHIYNALDMPESEIYLVESLDPYGPFGAKALAEVAQQSLSAAIVNAVADALGLRIRQLPLVPERILRALHVQSAQR